MFCRDMGNVWLQVTFVQVPTMSIMNQGVFNWVATSTTIIVAESPTFEILEV